jgi:hypothetical protein
LATKGEITCPSALVIEDDDIFLVILIL